jgi:hypothetical protein
LPAVVREALVLGEASLRVREVALGGTLAEQDERTAWPFGHEECVSSDRF